MLASIADPDPVLFLEPMRLYRGKRQEVPAHDYRIELGKGEIVQQGEDVTIFAWGAMMPIAMEAAELMKEQGISCEVIDLRTLYPLETHTLYGS